MRIGFQVISSMLLMASIQAIAAPIYYTFEGRVTHSTFPDIPGNGIVHYTFMADRELDGFKIENGHYLPMPDVQTGDNFHDYFRSEYVGGNAIGADLYPGYTLDFHYGSNSLAPVGGEQSAVRGSNFDNSGYDYVYAYVDRPMETWAVGQSDFYGVNGTHSSNGRYYVQSHLTLTAISNTNPVTVPEPSGWILAGLGLLLMAAYPPRFRKA